MSTQNIKFPIPNNTQTALLNTLYLANAMLQLINDNDVINKIIESNKNNAIITPIPKGPNNALMHPIANIITYRGI